MLAGRIHRNSLGYFHGEPQRSGRLKTGHARLAPGVCAFDKRHQLMLERFLPRDLYLLARDPAFGAPIDFAALFFIIEREISVLLKNADLAHPLRTDAAGSDICDTAILKSHPRVRDIFAAAQDRHTDSVDGLL